MIFLSLSLFINQSLIGSDNVRSHCQISNISALTMSLTYPSIFHESHLSKLILYFLSYNMALHVLNLKWISRSLSTTFLHISHILLLFCICICSTKLKLLSPLERRTVPTSRSSIQMGITVSIERISKWFVQKLFQLKCYYDSDFTEYLLIDYLLIGHFDFFKYYKKS